MAKDTVTIEQLSGCEGDSLVINNIRICGSKPWGGGSIIKTWKVKRSRIIEALGIIEQAVKVKKLVDNL